MNSSELYSLILTNLLPAFEATWTLRIYKSLAVTVRTWSKSLPKPLKSVLLNHWNLFSVYMNPCEFYSLLLTNLLPWVYVPDLNRYLNRWNLFSVYMNPCEFYSLILTNLSPLRLPERCGTVPKHIMSVRTWSKSLPKPLKSTVLNHCNPAL